MRLSEVVATYLNPLPAGIVLERAQIERSLKNAVRFYSGYATLAALESGGALDGTNSLTGTQDIDLTDSELALIRPLFSLYCEQENAVSLEASRALGLEVYGRSTTEIQGDIEQHERDLPAAAFYRPVESL